MTRRERGSLSIELAYITPAILALIALVILYGRVASVAGRLEAGTRDAARMATVARSYGDAQSDATRAVLAAFADLPACGPDNTTTEVSPNFVPGALLTVTAECTYAIADLGLPGAPGTLTARSQFTSPLDPNRAVSG